MNSMFLSGLLIGFAVGAVVGVIARVLYEMYTTTQDDHEPLHPPPPKYKFNPPPLKPSPNARPLGGKLTVVQSPINRDGKERSHEAVRRK